MKIQLILLQKQGFIRKDLRTLYPSYVSNSQNFLFILLKQQNLILKVYSSGLIDHLENELHPKCTILFGSARKGEYTIKSDIDIFIQSKEQSIDLVKFEKLINHRINLFFEENLNKLSPELFNNIVNGIKLSGYLRLK